jgi:hypothetical protein
MDLQQLKYFFAGNWLLQRQIFSPGRRHLYARASGQASFEATTDNRLVYCESGKLLLAHTTAPVSFKRGFEYHFSTDLMAVYFHDGPDKGKLYMEYTYDPASATLTPVERHLCVADLYDAVYHLTAGNSFTQRHTISGPKKDMFIETIFTR